MSTATRKNTQTLSYFIPGQPLLETFMPLSYSNQDHVFIVDYIISVFNRHHDFAMTVAMQISHRYLAALFHFNSAYLFWRHLFLTPKYTGPQTTGNTPNACPSPFNCFDLTTTTSTKATSQLKPLLNF